MSALRDALQRRRQELNPLTTTLTSPPQQFANQTPQSGISPFGYNPTNYTPISAAGTVRTYNPQQWTSNSLSPDSAVQYTPPAPADTGDVVLAPPPYSPPRSRNQAASPEESSPAHRASPAAEHRPSPTPSAAPMFPPPPGNRARAGSRDRPQPLFNLSSFVRKSTAPDPARLSPDIHRAEQSTAHRARPPPISVDLTPNRPEAPREAPLADDSAFTARPPASRRAASAGAISTPSSSRSRGSSTSRWEPGMPLPPPPPGPPPQASSRSQSMSRAPEPITSPPTRRPQLKPMSTLGPVPPTPAGWVDEDLASRGRSPNRGLTIDTSTPVATPPPAESTSSGSSGLSRARAVRGEPKSIRERRSESRTGKSVAVEEPSNNPWAEAITPSDIMVPMTVLGRRPTITKSTPRSARTPHTADTPKSSRTVGMSTPTLDRLADESRGSTPRPLTSSRRLEAPTPPFSPDQYSSNYLHDSPMIPPKSLPTPPPTNSQSRQSSETSPRPVSHLFHLPINDTVAAPSLEPSRPTSQQSSASFSSHSFTQEAIKRHALFAQREAVARTDEERVRLFAEFIVSESRLRRDKYASAIDAMGSELLELTRDLFRPLSSSQVSHSRHSSRSEIKQERGTSLPSLKTDNSESRPSSGSGAPSPNQSRPDSGYYNNSYKPSLSPIASLAASTAPDESSSRGRPSSRWWEVGQSGPSSPSMKLERSKRESKYMGVPREVRESLQWEDNCSTPSNIATIAGPSSQPYYGVNEYPPEKTGWHEQNPTSPPIGPSHTLSYSPAPPQTPKAPQNLLDVSRLVTLPPPYPRHYPAVNNNHPDLTSIRTSVRALSDTHPLSAIKSRFILADTAARAESTRVTAQRRQNLRTNISHEIESGSMTYADAAKLEAESALVEAEASKTQNKTSFELFQTSVIAPLNDLLMERIHLATTLFDTLRSQLGMDAQEQSPNLTQEEGDEQPELLEKLTLLKWIFEARETLHRELYDLLTERNERYADMVTSPYRLAGNTAKVVNAENFFKGDARKRALEAAKESMTRTEEFMDIVETNVVRGVEVQLSAFWDIAPGLSKVLEAVPEDTDALVPAGASEARWSIVIPREEYAENPGYERWPLQYLWSLLQHSSSSTYQFIESQINLLCLLHEVKTAVATAKARIEDARFESENGAAAGAETPVGVRVEEREEHVRLERENEERKLTEDLKEKVRCVEELWGSAIGEEFAAVKSRVKGALARQGGWEGVSDD